MADISSMPWGKATVYEKKDPHVMPPCKVIHCRAVASGTRETDLAEVMKVFGIVKALKLMPKSNQALVEFDTLESSIACVTYSQCQSIIVRGRQMYVNYSKSPQITRNFSSSDPIQTPTKVLLFTVLNVIHKVTVDTIKQICQQQNVQVQRAAIFHKNGLQAFVELESVDDATRIQQVLNGCDIYPGCCTLKIEFSRTEIINVRSNNEESYNIEIENTFPFGQPLKRKYTDLETAKQVAKQVAGSEGLPGVQSILAKVLSGGSMNGNYPLSSSMQPNMKNSLLSNNNSNNNNSNNNNNFNPNVPNGFPYVPSPYTSPPTHLPTQPNYNEQDQLNYNGQNQLNYNGQNQLNYNGQNQPNYIEQNQPNYTGQNQQNFNGQYQLNYMAPTQPNYLDQYNIQQHDSTFCDANTDAGANGGEGRVAVVFGIDHEKVNCDHLFNLFCCYGNIVKIKILQGKEKGSYAFVQYTDRRSTELAIGYLSRLTLFGQLIKVNMSKHPVILDSANVATLFDGSSAIMSYSETPNNRFKSIIWSGQRNDLFRIHQPSKVLHYFNAPPDCTERKLFSLFESFQADIPLRHKAISRVNTKSCLGLLEFSSVSSAVEALMLVSHVTLRPDQLYHAQSIHDSAGKGGAQFTFKLAFSTSQSISGKEKE